MQYDCGGCNPIYPNNLPLNIIGKSYSYSKQELFSKLSYNLAMAKIFSRGRTCHFHLLVIFCTINITNIGVFQEVLQAWVIFLFYCPSTIKQWTIRINFLWQTEREMRESIIETGWEGWSGGKLGGRKWTPCEGLRLKAESQS